MVNRGLIDGFVSLGGGDDRFDARHGTMIGAVIGGSGDDRFLIDDASISLKENAGEGNDTVIASVNLQLPDNFETLMLAGKKDLFAVGNAGDNVITGNGGDNRLRGGYGYDLLAGGKGEDVLFGGYDEDLFVFRTGDGRDVIKDFADGSDHFDLSDWKGMKTPDALMAHATEKQGDLILSFRGDQLTIENFAKADFDPGDYQG